MKAALLPTLLFTVLLPASGALIPYYNLDSLTYLSADVVLCEEGEHVEVEKKNYSGYTYTAFESKFTVLRVFKGERKPGDHITVEISALYTRRLADEALSLPREQQRIPPKGKALLFLERDDDRLIPVTGGVKLIVEGVVYCYGQFVTNPGGLWLRKMPPENIRLEEGQSYNEEHLLKDLETAIRRAREKDLSQKILILGGGDLFEGDPFSKDSNYFGMDPFKREHP